MRVFMVAARHGDDPPTGNAPNFCWLQPYIYVWLGLDGFFVNAYVHITFRYRMVRSARNLSVAGHADVTAILLVAGVGSRLDGPDHRPKVLLEFGGKTLLERHLLALRAHGIDNISLTVGYCQDAIRHEVARLGASEPVRFVYNPRYEEGSIVSLLAQKEILHGRSPILVMDGDVLYDKTMIARLLSARAENVLLVDRNIEPGDEPVKVCFRNDRIVDLRKKPDHAHDWRGESVGFFRFSAASAAALADRCAAYVEAGQTGLEYEEAIRDLILRDPERFAAVDISDLPWTEIDFADDVVRARAVILPRLESRAWHRPSSPTSAWTTP
jgi:choline kinase